MKLSKNIELFQLQLPRKPLPIVLFFSLCLNLIVAPAVYAAANGEIDRFSAWAIGLLGLLTFGLSIYLFVVIFQPERF
ncbi:K(+)-transporting ATPase subunit F [Aerosakkonemataceae cyanobacterium BLCC-F154]|uniref:K(+)-transporting ATPase subunit F n=1 Tax=Floridaenema fluviatile BLCC-F154 TaxID=3153640 RepID=A0ABV4YDH2_9CYAN